MLQEERCGRRLLLPDEVDEAVYTEPPPKENFMYKKNQSLRENSVCQISDILLVG